MTAPILRVVDCAPWCQEMLGGCGGGDCFSAANDTRVVGVLADDDDQGEPRLLQLSMYVERNLTYPEPGVDDLALIRIAVEHQGWNEDCWAAFTVEQAKQIRAHLDRLIDEAETSIVLLRKHGVGGDR